MSEQIDNIRHLRPPLGHFNASDLSSRRVRYRGTWVGGVSFRRFSQGSRPAPLADITPGADRDTNCPYQCYSSFAGQPLLISPELLREDGLLTDGELEAKPEFPEEKVDYELVKEYKDDLFHKAFQRFRMLTAETGEAEEADILPEQKEETDILSKQEEASGNHTFSH